MLVVYWLLRFEGCLYSSFGFTCFRGCLFKEKTGFCCFSGVSGCFRSLFLDGSDSYSERGLACPSKYTTSLCQETWTTSIACSWCLSVFFICLFFSFFFFFLFPFLLGANPYRLLIAGAKQTEKNSTKKSRASIKLDSSTMLSKLLKRSNHSLQACLATY